MPDLDIRLPDGMRRAAHGDWPTIGAITGDAFQNDPVSSWIFGNKRAMAPIFGRQARYLYLPNGICHVMEDVGATMWLLPSASKTMPLLGNLDIALTMIRYAGIGGARRGLRAAAEMDRKKPKTPHAYLFTIGVHSAGQGRGIGRRLLAPMLEALDRAGLPAYLENSNPRNHSFYAGHGFAHMAHFNPAKGAPPLEAMWREPS